ncbi:MAG: phosphoenolpyruvate-utilizing N-terminal domain-containing protein, partial [Kiloniellales bacterium]|nr:phosphoenolpyruvate-utilizing N-terminal domain-containing protein [Kiloniellales bacterium]
MTEVLFKGLGVTKGIAIAPLFPLEPAASRKRRSGSPGEEGIALKEALSRAGSALEQLMQDVGGEAADILEFQVMLLEDDDFLAPVFQLIGDGVEAHDAWTAVLEKEIAEYQSESEEEEVFTARANDLMDLHERVLDELFGNKPEPNNPCEPSIVLAKDLPPSRFLEMDLSRIAGIALEEGSRTSHVSLLARARGLPLIVGIGAAPRCGSKVTAILDAAEGSLVVNPSALSLSEAKGK